MSRPLGFPRGGLTLVRLVLGAVLVPLLLIAGVGGWLAWRLTPLQNFYCNAYAASSMGASQPHAVTNIRWVMKTAPGRKPERMAPGDAAPGGTRTLPIALSAEARAEGWQGVTLSARERIPSATLAPYLTSEIYDGTSLTTLLGLPALVEITLLIGLLLALERARQSWRSEPRAWWQTKEQERRHGRRTRGPELGPPPSPPLRRWLDPGIRLPLTGEGALAKLLPVRSYLVPQRLESSHMLLLGDTGSGKSSAIRQILRQVQQRGESAIIYDPAMDFVGEFYSPGRGDLILNPLDARCPYWNLGAEINRAETATAIAAAMLPEKEYEKAFFTDGPRRILAYLLRREPQPRDLLRMMADPARIEEAVTGTPLAALVDPAAPAQRAGVLASLNMVADALALLPEWEHERTSFATAEWQTGRTRWVFLTSSAEYRERVLPLYSVWLDLFILRMMSRCQDEQARPVWFVLDELASLNKLPQLHTAVTENRKYGNPVVLGFQGRSQLEKRYGRDAESMLSQPATKVFFKTSEPRAAKWISEAIGEIEVERLKESRTPALLGSKRTYAMEIATKPLVMASEIAGLAPLRAFIKQENRVVPVRFRLAKKRSRQPEFIERKMLEVQRKPLVEVPAPQPVLVASAPQAKAAIAPGPAAVPVNSAVPKKPAQSALPLGSVPKAAFVWDESQGID